MNRRLIYGSIVGMCLALAGVIVLQFYWVLHAYALKEEQFDVRVREAMTRVSEKLVRNEMQVAMVTSLVRTDRDTVVQRVETRMRKDTSHAHEALQVISELHTMELSSSHDSTSANNTRIVHRMVTTDSVLRVRPGIENGSALVITRRKPDIQFPDTQVFLMQADEYALTPAETESVKPLLRLNRVNTRTARDTQRVVKDKKQRLEQMLNHVAVELALKDKSLLERIGRDSLLVHLHDELQSRGIDTICAVALVTEEGDTVALRNKLAVGNPVFQVKLFPDDLLRKPGYLLLSFPSRSAYIYHSMLWLLAASVFFTMVITGACGTGVYVMLRQKKLADIKTDFINNMTHEFKTPIATISLAADALDNPQVYGDAAQMRMYVGMIRDENRRMHSHVEQVLQMALVERKELLLHFSPCRVDVLARTVTDSMQLQAAARLGQIRLQTDAEMPEVLADEHHLRNVLFNLLDNALKYSGQNPPAVDVRVKQSPGGIELSVNDTGIGMTREQVKKVFAPFYRVPTGNLHTVKGFGLGLSYSRAIIEAHGGKLEVTSEPGKGSTFAVWLPLQPGATQNKNGNA